MKPLKRKVFRTISIFLILNFLAQWLSPLAVYALTSGPGQPEFSSFEPVATTSMVDEFTGEFTYNLPVINIPGPDGSGYAASLSYHSGVTPEEESSWVGYGWTLNPGAINRGKQGFPDDYNGESVQYYNKIPDDWTVGVSMMAGLEIFSADGENSSSKSLFGLTVSPGIQYNYYKGFGTSVSINASAYNSLASLDYSVSGEAGHSFSAALNPGAVMGSFAKKKKANEAKAGELLEQEINDVSITNDVIAQSEAHQQRVEEEPFGSASTGGKTGSGMASRSMSTLSGWGSQYGMHALADQYRPAFVPAYTGTSTNVTLDIGATPFLLHIGGKMGLTGYYTRQTDVGSYTRYQYGYMYLSQSTGADATTRMMDYAAEKESMYNKRDLYLSIPQSAPDQFSVTGEGIGGTFRLYNKNVGHLYPTYVSSPTKILNLADETSFGENIEPATGFTLGVGHHTLEVQNWASTGNTGSYSYYNNGADEANFFRYNGDMGGNLVYTPSDAAGQASIANLNPVPGLKTFKPVINGNDIYTGLSSRSGRSAYVGYHTNSEMMQSQTDDNGRAVYYRSYTKPDGTYSDTWSQVSTGNRTGLLQDRIGELATCNEDGNLYVYGLPVYSSNETSMAYSVSNGTVLHNYLAYENVSSASMQVGEVRPGAYAVNYLLTQITTPDYIDRSFNGPSSDDFGGWTKFCYTQSWGSKDKSSNANWYNWRYPYTGLFYDRNELCDPRDDMASYSAGTKEVYYLKTIETKTHIAFFVTNQTDTTLTDASGNSVRLHGSKRARPDGIEAVAGAFSDSTRQGSKHLQNLEKIILYAKSASGQISGKPLKIVHLEYYQDGTDYSSSSVLCRNMPNAAAVYSNGKKAGKLTLKRVWFEYEGTSSSRISPYEFMYQYKSASDYQTADIKTTYSNIINYGSSLNQNPDYSIYNSDNWGNYRSCGASRHDRMEPWVLQNNKDTTFDAAAWHLKTIRLPSGGEILVQYEQNDYTYVQDEMAMGMVSLMDASSMTATSKNEVSSDNKYYLNLKDIDIDLNENGVNDPVEMDSLARKINNYITANPKLYFKFLYTLIGNSSPDLNGCAVDYITGYMNASATHDTGNNAVYISFTGNDSYRLPRDVCKDYYTRTKAGLNLSSDCSQPRDGYGSSGTSDAVSLVKGLTNQLTNDFTAGSNSCMTISLAGSFIRVPLIKAKKGGGVRVKRILMYDGGIESGDESLYGSEYFYLNEDGSSSGVATNEPAASREENALVNYLVKRAPQTMAQRIISGKDKENFEGPIGESLLPPPSVGYSRVITQNIHSGKSGTGFKISEYYTVHDYPFSAGVNVSPMNNNCFDYLPIPAVFVNVLIDNRWASQGYSFVMNAMHGQVERTALYGGQFVPGKSEDSYFKSYEQIHNYVDPGTQVPVMDEQGNISNQYLGRETDVSIEMKSVDDMQDDGNVQIDISLGIMAVYVVPEFSMDPVYLNFTEKKLRTHVITKVIRYAPVVSSITTTQDGIVHTTQNKVFSKHTGKPVVIVEVDGYDGLSLEESSGLQKGTYTNYSIPASYLYPQMKQKATNERYLYTASLSLSPVSGSIYSLSLPSATPVNTGMLSPGDLVRLSAGGGSGLFYISSCSSSSPTLIQLQVLSYVPSGVTSGTVNSIEVINSGYTNQLNLSAGSLLTYGANYTNPVTLPASPFLNSSGSYVQNSSLVNVLSANAQTYTDQWVDSLGFIGSDYGTSSNPNDYETGRRGKWRPSASYAYKSDVLNAVTGTNRVYTNAGAVTSFTGFNYSNLSSNSSTQWLKTNHVNYYTPNGNAVEESNILGVKSSARFGYNESVPVVVAKNAPYSSVLFTGFEDSTSAVTTYAHSGLRSWQLNAGSAYTAGNVTIDYYDDNGNRITRINSNGFSARFWLKTLPASLDVITTTLQCSVLNSASVPTYGQLNQIARVGDWTLYEAQFFNVVHSFNTPLKVQISNTGTQTVWIDDVRIQPLEAQVNCYVYDSSNLRLITSFDDQHFGRYYQYNMEGKLVRKLVETEEGMKTVTETQYNIPTKTATAE